VYLDTDIILSQIKERDWLKDIVKRKFSKIKEDFKTSAITVVECQIVLLREEGRDEAIKAIERIESLELEIVNEGSPGQIHGASYQIPQAKHLRLNSFSPCNLRGGESSIDGPPLRPGRGGRQVRSFERFRSPSDRAETFLL